VLKADNLTTILCCCHEIWEPVTGLLYLLLIQFTFPYNLLHAQFYLFLETYLYLDLLLISKNS